MRKVSEFYFKTEKQNRSSRSENGIMICDIPREFSGYTEPKS